MAGKAFKVTVPKSYNNVTEAKLVQRGKEVWVQLPANLVQDRRMSRKSVYMQDYNTSTRVPHSYRNVKAKVVTRHGNNLHSREDFLDVRGPSMPRRGITDRDLTTDFDTSLSSSGRKRIGRSFSSPFEGMTSRSRYENMKSKRNEPITALLPVMGNAKSPELGLDHHYASPSVKTRNLPMEKSYNDKAREALPGLGKWLDSGDMTDMLISNHSQTINGDDFLENPLKRPDLIDYDQKRSVTIRPPQRLHSSHGSSRSALERRVEEGHTILDNADRAITLDPPTIDNSAKRHELEILTKVNPETQLGATALDHLYQPSGYKTRSGYTIVGNNCERGNSVFLNSGAGNRGSFNIAPDWASERKKSIVVRN